MHVVCLVILLATAGYAHALSAPPPTATPGEKCRIAIIGGGSSGIFASASVLDAINQHDVSNRIDVRVYESTGEALRTLRSSHQHGILHDTSKRPRDILNAGYPRGRKEIASLLTKHFPPLMQQKWFEDRGVQFRTDPDGSMVMGEDSSDVCDVILQGGVQDIIEERAKTTSITKDGENGGFQLTINGNRREHCDCAVLATGNSRLGHQLASSLGHTISAPVRSCFAFTLDETPYTSYLEEGLEHLLPHVRLSYKIKLKGQKRPRVFKSEGPAQLQMRSGVVVLSGKAALSLSSLAAHELHGAQYKGSLFVHFCPDHLGGKVETMEEFLWQHRQDYPREVVGDQCPLMNYYVDYDNYDWETESFRTTSNECIPPNLWQGLTQVCGAPPGSLWSKMSPKKVRALAETIVGCPFEFTARGTATDLPFINTGGVLLSEIDMATTQSNVVEGLFCCGQVLDGDASSNSYSLMRDFATGRVAGENAVLFITTSLGERRNKRKVSVNLGGAPSLPQ